jgi:hypothetical protein
MIKKKATTDIKTLTPHFAEVLKQTEIVFRRNATHAPITLIPCATDILKLFSLQCVQKLSIRSTFVSFSQLTVEGK